MGDARAGRLRELCGVPSDAFVFRHISPIARSPSGMCDENVHPEPWMSTIKHEYDVLWVISQD
jgi:hypothetical protein